MVKKTCFENLKKEVKIWFYDRHFENNRWKTNLECFEILISVLYSIMQNYEMKVIKPFMS